MDYDRTDFIIRTATNPQKEFSRKWWVHQTVMGIGVLAHLV